jgi:hypothetical protein
MIDQERLENNARESAWQIGLTKLPLDTAMGIERGVAMGLLQRQFLLNRDRIVVTTIDTRDSTVVWSFEIIRDSENVESFCASSSSGLVQ